MATMDDTLAQFTSITSADPARAAQYLRVTEGNLEQAIQLYFESDGVDMEASLSTITQPVPRPSRQPDLNEHDVIEVDSEDDEAPVVMSNSQRIASIPRAEQEHMTDLTEGDEAIARRLQEEMYGQSEQMTPGLRAPMARQAQVLADPNDDWRDDPDEIRSAIAEQLRAREVRRAGRPGIFNQRPPSAPSIWEEGSLDADARRQHLARATAGASEASSKSSMLAEMYRPPFEMMSTLLSWEAIRNEGKNNEKWILVNVQDPNIFDCQVLNRDVWKNQQIQDTVREHFIFKQYTKGDPQAESYVRYYFQAYESMDAYPHMAIIDPRTGEQMKVWSGLPAPKPMEFLMQLHEFLDRYSLSTNSRNPVATRKSDKKKELNVGSMSEEEMLEMAVQNSLVGGPGPKEDDPDVLTKSFSTLEKGKARLTTAAPVMPLTPENGVSNGDGHRDMSTGLLVNDQDNEAPATSFSQITASKPHVEPPTDAPDTTRIQFRHPGGRVIRRFALDDPVRRIYEWLKASPIEGKEGADLELRFMGKDLVGAIDQTIREAGLKNGTVMVEFTAE